MFRILFVLFVVVPLADLFLLVWLSNYMGLWLTIGLVLLTAIIGAALAKSQGRAVQQRIASQLQKQQFPSELLTDGAMILFASALLLTPGLLTDLFGFSLLTPQVRGYYKRTAMKFLKKRFKMRVIKPGNAPNATPGSQHPSGPGPGTIEGQVVNRDQGPS